MAYFLKKATLKGRTYLSIVESYYDSKRKETAHRTYKSLSSIETLINNGIDDPVAYYQKEVDKLNEDRLINEANLISDKSPKRYLGYFPIRALMNKLEIKKTIDLFKLVTNYDFDLYEVFSSLIYSRIVKPCSKNKTYYEVIPYLFESHDFSYDQLLEALNFFGNDYEKFVEMFTYEFKRKYKYDTKVTYFDCTNFYFEIDREDDFRKKGPSKENRKEPLVGLGLLLDANQIPIGMKLYPGNESEKPVLRKVIDDLKERHEVDGRTIHVADKGLNCANNIYFSKQNGDGYLFSKSVKQLPSKELTWVLLDNDYKNVKDKDGNILYKYKSCVDKFPYIYTDDKRNKHKFELTEKRLITYNPTLAKKQIFEIDKMVEKAKYLCLSKAKKDEYGESSKYVNFKGKDDSKVEVSINIDKVNEDKRLAGYNLLVTSETKMKDKDIYDTYHNLWRIEESFRIMKSDLDARPVYLQKQETIQGHFLICYAAVFLERIFQFIVLENKYSSESIFKFMKDFELCKNQNDYTNLASSNTIIKELKDKLSLPITNLHLTEKQVQKILNYKI